MELGTFTINTDTWYQLQTGLGTFTILTEDSHYENLVAVLRKKGSAIQAN